jgi:hypothetical protein
MRAAVRSDQLTLHDRHHHGRIFIQLLDVFIQPHDPLAPGLFDETREVAIEDAVGVGLDQLKDLTAVVETGTGLGFYLFK